MILPQLPNLFRERVAVDAESGGGADQVAVVSGHDLSDKALFELRCRFGKKDSPLNHLRAEDLQSFFEA